MNRKEKKEEIRKQRLRNNFKSFCNHHETIIKIAQTEGRIKIKKKLKSIENLFTPFPKNREEVKKFFRIPISKQEYKSLKKAHDDTDHLSNKPVKKYLQEIVHKQKIQKFRNLEILRVISQELKNYEKKCFKNIGLTKMKSEKGKIGELSKSFIEGRKRSIKMINQEMKLERKKMKGREFVNDIDPLINSYIDFFSREEDKFTDLKKKIDEILIETDEQIAIKCIGDSSETILELPSWRLFLETE